MKNIFQKTGFAIVCGVVCIGFALPALAREAYFSPALGEVNALLEGPERATVTEDGAVLLSSYSGDSVEGFPVFIEDSVVASSPVFGNISGDNHDEVVFLARHQNGVYTLYMYTGSGQAIHSIDLGQTEIYVDPVVVTQASGQLQDILIMNVDGVLTRFRYENNQFTSSVIAEFNAPATIATSDDYEELCITFPEQSRMVIFVRGENDNWTQDREVVTSEPIIYPITDSGSQFVYGVGRSGQVHAIDRVTGNQKQGFPVHVDSMPSGKITLAEIDNTRDGTEFIVTLSNGKQVAIEESGTTIGVVGKNSFLDLGVVAEDPAKQGVFSSIKTFASTIGTQVEHTIISVFSRIRTAVTGHYPEIAMVYGNSAYTSGTIIDFGSTNTQESAERELRVQNKGTSRVVLTGNPAVRITNDAAGVFTITKQPFAIVKPGEQSVFSVQFQPNVVGEFSATIEIDYNSENGEPFVLHIVGRGAQNMIQDGDMEDPGVDVWRSYGSATIKEKSLAVVASGAQSMHIDTGDRGGGIQQIAIPVEAGRWYTLQFSYNVTSGTIHPRLGIRSSNADFEGKSITLHQTNNVWQTYTRDFYVPDDFVRDFRLVLAVRSADLYIDDVLISPIADPPLVEDGNMEAQNVDAWRSYGNPEIKEKDTETFYSGAQSVHVSGSGGIQQKNIPVQAGNWYRLEFAYNILSGTAQPRLGIRSSNGDFEGQTINLTQTGNEWQMYSRDFYVPDDFVRDLRLVFNLRQADMYIDDVVIAPTEAPEIVVDGDMEMTHTGSWARWGESAVLEKRTDHVFAGQRSLYIQTTPEAENSHGGVQKLQIALESGHTYRLSFAYRLRGLLIPRIGIGSSNNDFDAEFEQSPQSAGYSVAGQEVQWQNYERVFTIPENASTDIRLVFALFDREVNATLDGSSELSSGQVWIDSVDIEEIQ